MRWLIVIFSFSLSAYLVVLGLPEELNVPFMRKSYRLPENSYAYKDYGIYLGFGMGAYALIFMTSLKSSPCVCKIKGLKWDLNDFCRGWLITGKTGSGKTASAIAHILHQLFQRVKPDNKLKLWGGVAVDQKGNFFKIIEDIASNYEQSHRLITLQVRPEGAVESWKPKFRYNLVS